MENDTALRILYIHQYFRTPTMTGGTRSYEFAKRLVTSGHDVQMITADNEGLHGRRGRWTKTNEDGIDVHWLRLRYNNKLPYRRRVAAFARFAVAAAGKARRLGGDIVFATSTPLTVALPGAYASRTLRIPMVFEVRDLWPELPIAMKALRRPMLVRAATWLERFAYSRSARIVALSPGMGDGVARTGYPKDRIEIIPNSCDNDSFACSPSEGRRYLMDRAPGITNQVISYTGTLGRINGIGYLVKIAAAMQKIDASISFVIAGDGLEADQIRAEAVEAGVLGKSLWMLGRVPKLDIPKILAGSAAVTSLFIDLPAMWNNSANKFFDGLAAGRPIAINYQGWQAELLERSKAGIVLPASDPEDAAARLKEFLSSKLRLEEASTAARRLAEQQFDRDLLFERFQATILSAAKDGPTKRRRRC